jgi:hypothetical protein
MDIAAILTLKYAGSEWTLDGDNYEGLTWLSDSPKPDEKELTDLWPEVQSQLAANEQAKIDAKSSLLAKLAALGLTEEEIAAL